MRRFTPTTCLLALWLLGPAAKGPADEIVPQRPVSPQNRILEDLVGTWDVRISGGSDDSSASPAPIDSVTRTWVANRTFVYERGSDHDGLITFDANQGLYRAWYFHANGHVWELNGRWTGGASHLSLSADLNENQSITRNYQLTGKNNHECTITWTDEDGRIGVYGSFNFTRASAAAEPFAKQAAPARSKNMPPPPEMKVLARDVGKWILEISTTSGEKTTKATGSSTNELILGGQFLKTTLRVFGQEGDITCIYGFDAPTKSYRSWYFSPDGAPSEPAIGSWDDKRQTETWKCHFSSDTECVEQRRWLSLDTVQLHKTYNRQNGEVISTEDILATRQGEK